MPSAQESAIVDGAMHAMTGLVAPYNSEASVKLSVGGNYGIGELYLDKKAQNLDSLPDLLAKPMGSLYSKRKKEEDQALYMSNISYSIN